MKRTSSCCFSVVVVVIVGVGVDGAVVVGQVAVNVNVEAADGVQIAVRVEFVKAGLMMSAVVASRVTVRRP